MDNERFIQLPSGEEIINDITPQEQLIYLGIRSFMNKDTMIAFPSLETLSDIIGASIPTIRKGIKSLEEKDYLKVNKNGKKNIYKFNELKQFEPFSYDFLKNKSLTFTQKAVLASSQRFMEDKQSGIGKVSYSKMELANKINMPYSTLARTTNELAKKDILDIVKLEHGQQMQFNLEKYHQGIVKVLINHEERIESTEDRVYRLELQVQQLQEQLNEERSKNSKSEIII